MRRLFANLLAHTLVMLALAVAPAGAVRAAAPGLPSHNVAWLSAAADADIDQAFAAARAQDKPLLLYWGASWCPPCNQLKATLFNRQDFALQARSFVAVHVDGDRPGAQRLGQRFKVSGYPTLVLFDARGVEITRLPGEVDPPQVLALLQLGMAGGRPVKAVLADAQAGRALSASEWRLLAFYSWGGDDGQLVSAQDLPALLVKLAVASPASDQETKTRLWLMALAASDDGKGVKPDAALRERVRRLLADAAAVRRYMDLIGSNAAALVRVLASEGLPEQSAFVPLFDGALRRLAADTTLSRGDRQSATISRIDLARLGFDESELQVDLPAPLLQELREQAARDDREITDAFERQAVIPGWGYALARAGLWQDSDALLKANLTKSPAPYYLMSQLGSNARKLGHDDEALRWYRQAFDASVGPATRLQWGSSYLKALIELAPADTRRIEQTASQLLREAARDGAAFEGRSAYSMQRIGRNLMAWNRAGQHDAALGRLRVQLDGVCAAVAADGGRRQSCLSLLTAGKPA